MVESTEDTNASTSFPYGFLISCILVDPLVNLSNFKPTEISTTYHTWTFSCMGCVLVGDKWHSKDSVKSKTYSTDLASQLQKDIKACLLAVENGIEMLQESVGKILQMHKDTSTYVGKLRILMDGLKQEGVSTMNKMIKQVDSLKKGAKSSNNKLVVSVPTSYSNFSKNV